MAFSIPNEADAGNPNQAEVDKVDIDILVAGIDGTGVVSGCAVTAQGTPDMTVAVASGSVIVAGTTATVSSGNVTVGTADATNPRFDLITVNNAGTKACTAGTAAANPVFPAIPADSVVLAAIYVPANDGDIDADQIIDKRVSVIQVINDSTFTAASTTNVNSATATKTYIDTEIAALEVLEAGIRTSIDTSNPGFLSTDVSLAGGLAGGDTLTGGTAASENLLLASTAHATKGSIFLLDGNPTYTAAPAPIFGISSARTITANYASQKQPTWLIDAATYVMTTSGNSGAIPLIGIDWNPTYKNANAVAAHLAASSSGVSGVLLYDRAVIKADGATINLGNYQTIRLAPTFIGVSGGAFTAGVGAYAGFALAPTVTDITVPSILGFALSNPTVTGTGLVDLFTAISIPAPASSGVTLSIGLLNASTTVLTPKTQTISAASDTVVNTSSIIRLTTTGAKTMTSAPTLENGENGQVITLINTGADNIVLQDQGTLGSSNLRLGAATRTLTQRSTISLVYSTTVGDWVELMFHPAAQAQVYTQTYSTASRTQPAPTAATLTDNSGGTANTTLEAISATFVQSEIRNNFADLAAMENKNTADVLALNKVVVALIDDLQAAGVVA